MFVCVVKTHRGERKGMKGKDETKVYYLEFIISYVCPWVWLDENVSFFFFFLFVGPEFVCLSARLSILCVEASIVAFLDAPQRSYFFSSWPKTLH